MQPEAEIKQARQGDFGHPTETGVSFFREVVHRKKKKKTHQSSVRKPGGGGERQCRNPLFECSFKKVGGVAEKDREPDFILM